MEKRKNPLSINVIYWLTQVIFWLIVLVFFGAVIINVLLQFETLGSDLQIHTQLPVEVSYTEKGTLDLFYLDEEIEFVEATGKIHFINTNPTLAKWFGGLLIGVISILLYIFLMWKRFIGNVYRGLVFERFNIEMLKKMSYGLVVLWGFMVLYSRLFYHFIATHIKFEHLEISSSLRNYGFILMIALFLWVLSHILLRGVKIQEEQSLTV